MTTVTDISSRQAQPTSGSSRQAQPTSGSSRQVQPTSHPSPLTHLSTTPGRIVGAAGLMVVLAGIAAGLIASFAAGTGGGLRSLAGQDVPEVTATTGLYFSLNDMDAQVANVLLVGTDRAQAADRSQDLVHLPAGQGDR
jgi:hypothetical protein